MALLGTKPMYLRIRKYGNTIRTYASIYENAMVELSKVTLPSSPGFVGLAQSAPNGQIGSSTFAKYKIKNYDPMSPVLNLLLGD
jgi:hypothetical protein